MVEDVEYERKAIGQEGHKSAMDKSSYMKMGSKPWHTPLDSVGPVATGRAPTMPHALDMIQQLCQPQYEGHGGMDAKHSGMPEGENLMRRTMNYLNRNPR